MCPAKHSFLFAVFFYHILTLSAEHSSAVAQTLMIRSPLLQVIFSVPEALIIIVRDHEIPHRPIRRKSLHREDIVQASRHAVLLKPRNIICSCGDILLLPVPPDAVDAGVVKEEQGVIGRDFGAAHLAS